MIKIAQWQAEKLREKGFGKYVNMCNRTHKARGKRYFMVESPKAFAALDKIKADSKK